MRRFNHERAVGARRKLAWGAVPAIAAIAVCAWPAVAGAAYTELTSSGPLATIDVSTDLGCQIGVSGDSHPSFWGMTGSPDAGDCGTWLALNAASTGTVNQLYGSTLPLGGPRPSTNFTAVSQSQTGSGSATDPYLITTVATVPSGVAGTPPAVIGTVTEVDSYVVGQSAMDTKVTVAASTGSALTGRLYHAGDCYVANNDSGYGAYVASTGSVQCTTTPGNSPPAREMDFTPVTAGSSWVEDSFNPVWDEIGPTAAQLSDTVLATMSTDNAMGLSWPVSLAAGTSATYEFTTQITPNVAPTSTTAAGPCTENGVIAITTNEPNGPSILNYQVDGGTPQTAPVTTSTASTNVTLPTTPGVHTITYWAEDATSEQEATHHTFSVTVEPNGPAVNVTSDQNVTAYEVGDPASVSTTVVGVGVTTDPTAPHQAIPTTTPGSFTITKTAVDACGSASAQFIYTVLPQPVLGQNVNVEVVSGKVFIKLPTTHARLNGPLQSAIEALTKGSGFIALTQARQIPVGAILDTTAGVASITSATNKKHQFFKGSFGAGVFKILQNRKQKGLTRLNLMDKLNAKKVCPAAGKSTKASIAAGTKKLSSKVLGLLKGNAHGGYTTYGQYSAATVRGTVWSVSNRCDGTLTHVTRGEVIVQDFRRHKKITLTTGKSYLAKA